MLLDYGIAVWSGVYVGVLKDASQMQRMLQQR
jgi:predicted component of type VI protein secretion system